jgi:predicted DNA-binding transcriptional regulator AlpA
MATINTTTRQSSRALTRREAAAMLGLSPRTLARWAKERRGPDYSRTGTSRGRALYAESDVREWLARQKVFPPKGS